MKSPVVHIVAETVMMLATHTLAAKTFGAFWKRVSPKLGRGVEYIEAHEGEGLEPGKTFLEILTFRDPQITRIVDGCLKEFLSSDVLRLIRQVQHIEDRIGDRREQINAWKLGMISAPSSSLMPLKTTRMLLERRIKKEYATIEDDKARIERLKTETLMKLKESGIEMTDTQLDGLLYVADGTELAGVMAVAQNVRAVEKQLSEQLKGPDTTADQIKTYTGLVTMCYRVYIAAIERACSVITNRYLKRLGEIKLEAHAQMLRADALSQKKGRMSAVANNNLDLNAHTIELAQRYEAYLKGRLADLAVLVKEMKGNYALSLNTFRTVKVGGELIDVIKASEKDLESIFEFEPPQIEAFYDEKLRREFDLMTAKLKSPAK